jgi:galactonate dehydratase
MALWDIKGKALHVPVYQCLGGRVRDRVRVCVSLPPGQRAEESADVAARLAALGVTALKCPVRPRHTGVAQRGDLEDVAERVARIREAAGPDVDLIIDLQSTSTPALARQISRVLERFRPCLMSEPIEPAGLTGLTRLTTRTRVPTCVDGSSRPTSLGLLETRAAGVLRLDVGACGGLIAARHVASAAEIGYTAVIAADTGGWIGAAATRQFAAATPNVLFLELPDHPRLWEGALLPSFGLEAGHLPLGEEPGLGAEPMVEAIRAAGGSVTAC